MTRNRFKENVGGGVLLCLFLDSQEKISDFVELAREVLPFLV